MKTKIFELRDKATCLVVVATKMEPESKDRSYKEYERELMLLRKLGFSDFKDNPLVMLTLPNSGKNYYIPYQWNDRTLQTAHKYIQDNFDELEQDDVIDIEYILGETNQVKPTEVGY
jgi:hypothetical protein